MIDNAVALGQRVAASSTQTDADLLSEVEANIAAWLNQTDYKFKYGHDSAGIAHKLRTPCASSLCASLVLRNLAMDHCRTATLTKHLLPRIRVAGA